MQAGTWKLPSLTGKNPKMGQAQPISTQNKRHAEACLLFWSFGADDQIRTGDLVLTKDVLCLLSHISMNGDPHRARTDDL